MVPLVELGRNIIEGQASRRDVLKWGGVGLGGALLYPQRRAETAHSPQTENPVADAFSNLNTPPEVLRAGPPEILAFSPELDSQGNLRALSVVARTSDWKKIVLYRTSIDPDGRFTRFTPQQEISFWPTALYMKDGKGLIGGSRALREFVPVLYYVENGGGNLTPVDPTLSEGSVSEISFMPNNTNYMFVPVQQSEGKGSILIVDLNTKLVIAKQSGLPDIRNVHLAESKPQSSTATAFSTSKDVYQFIDGGYLKNTIYLYTFRITSQRRHTEVGRPDGFFVEQTPDETLIHISDNVNGRYWIVNETTDDVSGPIAFKSWANGVLEGMDPNSFDLQSILKKEGYFWYGGSVIAKDSDNRPAILCKDQAGTMKSILLEDVRPSSVYGQGGMFFATIRGRNVMFARTSNFGIVCFQIGDDGRLLEQTLIIRPNNGLGESPPQPTTTPTPSPTVEPPTQTPSPTPTTPPTRTPTPTTMSRRSFLANIAKNAFSGNAGR